MKRIVEVAVALQKLRQTTRAIAAHQVLLLRKQARAKPDLRGARRAVLERRDKLNAHGMKDGGCHVHRRKAAVPHGRIHPLRIQNGSKDFTIRRLLREIREVIGEVLPRMVAHDDDHRLVVPSLSLRPAQKTCEQLRRESEGILGVVMPPFLGRRPSRREVSVYGFETQRKRPVLLKVLLNVGLEALHQKAVVEVPEAPPLVVELKALGEPVFLEEGFSHAVNLQEVALVSEVPRGAAEEGRLIAGLLEQIEDARRLFQHDAERVGVRIVVNVDRQMRERHP